MKLNDVVVKIRAETGIALSKSRLLHYDRQGLLGELERDSNGYRILTNKDYDYIKLLVMLGDLGVPIEEAVLAITTKTNTLTNIKVLNNLRHKQSNIKYIIRELTYQ